MGARPSQAPAVIDVINQLAHTKGEFAGQPFNLRPWQKRQIITPLFKTRSDGRRQYRTCLLMLPRKNGKSELAAALAIYFLLFDGEQGAEVYSAAADQDQAALVFNVAAQMIRQHPILNRACDVLDSTKRITHKKSGSFYRAISAEAYSKHGFNASAVIYDELHAARSRELFDVLATSQGARSQPMLLVISTAGYDRHSILWELYDHAKHVQQDPSIDPTFLPILYEAPKEADWTDRKVWRACNPALGDFRSIEEMEIACARAREIPAQENVFRRLYLNQWTEQAARWIAMETWDGCRIEDLDFRRRLTGRRCYLGLDLSSTKDLTALVAVFPDDDGGFDVWPAFFCPAESIRARSERDRVPYEQWVREGYLIATPGNTVDYEAVRATVRDWSDAFEVREVGYDRWNATDLITRMKDHDGVEAVPVTQGFPSLTSPTKALEKAILAKRLRHDGNPVLRWNISNAATEQDAQGNIKLSKKVSTERIDGAAALVMAVDMLGRFGHTPTPQYEVMFFGGR